MIEPVVKEVRVPASPEVAFRRFTEGVGGWWPKATHSVSKEKCRAVFWPGPAGSDLYEVDEDGNRHVWGTFSVWEPPSRLALTWHPGRGSETAQTIEITFEPRGEETLVTLRHGGFEALGDTAQAARDDYDQGWSKVLAMYRSALP
ncbi:MAG TPA: SRPBCC domain-containing protein [Longimicrobiales bacterium]|jgi:uncharacterized protein YndB with AHSA1/START domain